jgi:hypothetical protein
LPPHFAAPALYAHTPEWPRGVLCRRRLQARARRAEVEVGELAPAITAPVKVRAPGLGLGAARAARRRPAGRRRRSGVDRIAGTWCTNSPLGRRRAARLRSGVDRIAGDRITGDLVHELATRPPPRRAVAKHARGGDVRAGPKACQTLKVASPMHAKTSMVPSSSSRRASNADDPSSGEVSNLALLWRHNCAPSALSQRLGPISPWVDTATLGDSREAGCHRGWKAGWYHGVGDRIGLTLVRVVGFANAALEVDANPLLHDVRGFMRLGTFASSRCASSCRGRDDGRAPPALHRPRA